jgi:ferric-dicitrate binding protein FerR (iron transport regulator)
MSARKQKEDEVRLLLEQVPHPPVPADLLVRATVRGIRRQRRRRVVRRVLWVLAVLVFVAFLVWASIVEPWLAPPADSTPPLEGF